MFGWVVWAKSRILPSECTIATGVRVPAHKLGKTTRMLGYFVTADRTHVKQIIINPPGISGLNALNALGILAVDRAIQPSAGKPLRQAG